MAYPQAVHYLNSFVNYEKKRRYSYQQSFKLERMEGFLQLLGNPQDSLQCLHIAGTKGKGSVCAFLAYILKEAGFKAGLYTSPHLVDFRERIRILNPKSEIRNPKKIQNQKSKIKKLDDFEGMISKREIARLVERLKPFIEKYNRTSQHGSLTFFEVYTALAFLYFQKKKVDYAVLETGLGGRLDATNTVNPLACGITPISYDHMDILGKSLIKIAKEKAGIIKKCQSVKVSKCQSVVICAPQEKEAQGVIQKRCLKEKAKLYEVGKDIVWRAHTVKGKWQSFEVRGLKRKYTNLKIKLLGEHQLDNASLAIGMAEVLENKRLSPQVIKRGLMNACWPGRLEIVGRKPTIILDGAQNAASARVLKESVKENFNYGRLILILGISNDKDRAGICSQLDELADEIILTKADNPRAVKPGCLAKYFKDKKTHIARTVKEALGLAVKKANAQDLVLVTGSLFIAGEARKIFMR